MKRCLPVLALVGLLALQGCAILNNPYVVSKKQDSRFIPVEMWTGQWWDGKQEVVMTPADFTFGSRGHKTIKGPMALTHPATGKRLEVYERVNRTQKGIKRQLFTLTPDGRGLAKVYDERPKKATRYFSSQAVLFPVGEWKRGEKRTFTFHEYINGKAVKRRATIHIRRLSFTYKDVRYALKYDYLMHDHRGKIVFHERFIYGPGKGLMYYKNRL